MQQDDHATTHVSTVDCDGHIMEPEWLWREYLERDWLDEALHIGRDPTDGDKLVLGSVPSRLIRRLGGVAPDGPDGIVDWNRLPTRDHFVSYQDSCTRASWDGAARLRWMSEHGIDATLLFPSLGLIWPREVDPRSDWAQAHYRAYNRWIRDMTSIDPRRLVPVAMIGADGAVPEDRQLESVLGDGFRHVMLPLGAASLGALADRFWALAQEAGVVVHLHKVAIPHFLDTAEPMGLRSSSTNALFRHSIEILPGQLCLTALIDSALLDRFSGLRFAFHEVNAGWVPSWIDRMTESYDTLLDGNTRLPEQRPAHYVFDRDSVFFSIGLDESVENMVPALHSRLLMATDYPHPGSSTSPAVEWKKRLDGVSDDFRVALMGGNASRLVGV